MTLDPVLFQSLVLFFYISVGFIAAKAGVITREGGRGVSRLLVNVTLPALIVSSMVQPYDPALFRQVIALIAISFAVYGVSIAFALVAKPLCGTDPERRGIYRFGLVFSNVGFMGFPIMTALFGTKSVFQVAIYNIAFQLLAFSVGTSFLRADRGDRGLPPARAALALLNPNIIAAFVGLALFLSRWQPPAVGLKAVSDLGAATTPLSMVYIGSVLAGCDLKGAFASPRIWAVSLLRCIGIPLLLWLALRPLASAFGFPLEVPVLIAAMPVAANAAILAEEHGSDVKTASSLVLVSTVLSMATIPLMARLLFKA